MSRIGWLAVGVMFGVGFRAPPTALQVQRLELVDARGEVVAHLGVTESGAELVLGGQSQASLVSDGATAALNLLTVDATARVVAAPGQVWPPECNAAPTR